MHAHRLVLLAVAAALVLPAGAAAQPPVVSGPTAPSGPTGPTGPAATPTPAPAPPPVKARAGHLRIHARAPLHSRGKKVALRGARVKVTGKLSPAVAGQRVVVRLTHGKKTIKKRHARTKADGTFKVRVRLKRPGRLVLRAMHKHSKLIKRAHSRRIRIATFRPRIGSGSHSALVRLFQAHLAGLRFASPRSGVYDDATGRAVLAYRKLNGFARTFTPSARIVRRVLDDKGGYTVRHPHAGHHVEADLSLQILVLIDGDKVFRIYHTSSGKPSTPTVTGHYRFYSKTPGTNSEGMVDANYFIRGYAIHGYASVPDYAASHGCLRVPIPDARGIFDWIRLGDGIFVTP